MENRGHVTLSMRTVVASVDLCRLQLNNALLIAQVCGLRFANKKWLSLPYFQ
jgi:hypothetical protein